MKDYYMIGNSHIDPVWFWNWEEGMQEVRATLASAVQRMEEFPEFHFTCSSTSFLEWIEEVDPPLFEALKEKIQSGQMEMVGGWFLEPDCLLPCGEAFVRHGLYGQRYLQNKLGKKAHIGFNIDSFGHSAGLPQILLKSGLDTYVFMRPRLEEPLFSWEGPDGSRVRTLCLPGEYTTWFHDPLVKNIRDTLDRAPQHDKMTVFFGVGDHGGGPTVANIQSVQALKEAIPSVKLQFSTLDRFFREAGTENQPTLRGPFEKINQGCYSVDAPFKALYRNAEQRLQEADRLMAMVYLAGGDWMPQTERMESLWKTLLFNQFHDTMGGTTIREGRNEALLQMGAVAAQAGMIRGMAMQKLAQQLITEDHGFPLFVVNPTNEDYDGLVEAELEWFCQNHLKLKDPQGREVPYQRIHTDAKVRHTTLGGRRRFLFRARIPAYGARAWYVTAQEPTLAENDHFEITDPNPYVLDNGIVRAEFDPATGGLSALTELKTGYQCLSGPTHFCLYRDERDCWGGIQGRIYEDRKVPFTLDSIETIESGSLRKIIRVRSHFEATTAEVHYILEAGSDALKVRNLLRFNHPWHLVKYALPLQDLSATTAETACAVHTRQAEDDTEFNMQRFVDAYGEEGRGLAIANDGKYAYNVVGDELRLTITRSAIFAQGNSRDWYNTVETYEYTDMGEHRWQLLLKPHGEALPVSRLHSLSAKLDRPWEYLLDTVHRNPAAGVTGDTAAKTGCTNVKITMMKKAQEGNGLILRLLETDGLDTGFTLTIGEDAYPLTIGHNALDTYLWQDHCLTPVNLLEEPIYE